MGQLKAIPPRIEEVLDALHTEAASSLMATNSKQTTVYATDIL